MLSASGDFVPLNLCRRALLGANGKWSKNSSETYTCKFKMSSSSGDFLPWIPDQGFDHGPHWGKLPDHFTGSLHHACSNSSKLYYTFSITPVLLCNHICTNEKNINSHFKIFFIHCIWCLSMFPLPRRCQFSEGKHYLFLHVYPGFTTPTIKIGIYYSIMSST